MDDEEYYLQLIKGTYNYAKNSICQRLTRINFNADLFKLEETVSENGEPYLVVSYDSKAYLIIRPYRRSYRNLAGQLCCRGSITIKRKDDAAWYNKDYKTVIVSVNEHMGWEVDKKEYDTDTFLDHFLPVMNQQTCEIIKNDLSTLDISSIDDILFDTMNQRYVLNVDFLNGLNPKADDCREDLFLCKYMSLDTFLCIAQSNSMRLNSVVSMNDSSESFFLGDYLCNAYDDVRRKNIDFDFYQKYPDALRYSKLIEHKNYLIMSLTKRIDDAMMWRLYGDNGRGVCLCFSVPTDQVKPIIYISEKNEKLNSLKNIVSRWEDQNINVTFDAIDKYMFFTKSLQFEYEDEYRILKVCADDDLKIAKYGNLISFYNDFKISDLAIKPTSLYIGSNLPNRDVNYPLLVDIAKRLLHVSAVNNSSVDQLRV